jgi:hypothetical protein
MSVRVGRRVKVPRVRLEMMLREKKEVGVSALALVHI